MIKIGENLDKASAVLLSIIVFLIPLSHKFIAPFIALWAIVSVYSIIKNKLKFVPNLSLIGLLCFYALLIVGLFWTDNMKAGTFDLEVKLSLAIFPLLFLFKQYTMKHIRWIVFAFFIGLMLSSLFLIFNAEIRFLNGAGVNTFLYADLSKRIHPTYMSFYYVSATAILLINLKERLFLMDKMISIFLLSFFFCFNILLLSKVGIIASTLLVVLFVVFWAINKKRFLSSFIVILGLSGLLFFSYQSSDFVRHRVGELIYGLFPDPDKKNNGSTGIRIQVWTQGLELIQEKPILGYGTGDVKDELIAKYEKSGMCSAYDKELNAHNQFIQIAISIGLLGFLLFLFVLYKAIENGIKQRNLFILTFVILFITYAFTESVLENQAGTIFFALFFCLLNQKVFSANE